jgi:hypothetical protein
MNVDVFYSDNELYLKFLGIELENIPIKDDKVNKQQFYKLVENHFRNLIRECHPDFGGNEEQYKFLLKSKQFLLEEMQEDKSFSLDIDNDKLVKFDKNSLAAKLGNQLFELLSSWQEELKIKPVFKPQEENDEYEWIFNTEINEYQLCLNIQNLSEEYAELSSKTYQDDNLNVLVCLFVPSKKLAVKNCAYDNSVVLNFNDKILIESSNAKNIAAYFTSYELIKKDLEKVYNNQFISKENELKTKNIAVAQKADQRVLDYLRDIKLFNTQYDENADEFLNKL